MVGNEIKIVNSKYQEILRDQLIAVYKDVTGLDFNEFVKIVKEDVANKKAEAEKSGDKWDTGFESDIYIKEKAQEAFNVALSQYKSDHNIDIEYSEEYEDGKTILEYNVTRVIEKRIIPLSFSHDFEVGEMKRIEVVEK